MTDRVPTSIEKLETGIAGFDELAQGGLPKGRTTLVSGTSGSGKTVFAIQFLAEGIRRGAEGGVFVTFEEPPKDIRKNVLGLGWDIERWEDEGKWTFVDASTESQPETVVSGPYDLGALLARVEHAVKKLGAARVAIDSFGALLNVFDDAGTVRRELFRIASALKRLGVTSVLTAECPMNGGGLSRWGVEEFVSDNVVVLRNVASGESRRRTLEVVKLRGAGHHRGEFPFSIVAGRGIVSMPLSTMALDQRSSDLRITSGNPGVDRMCGGGFFRDSVVLVSGATGIGKSLLTTGFIAGGVSAGEPCLYLGFEESRDQLARNAAGWGVDFAAMEQEGKLRIVCQYPEAAGLEDHLIRIQDAVDRYRPLRVAVDSLSALERVARTEGFREFAISLTAFLKARQIAGLLTSTTPALVGGTSVTEAHISTIADAIILLRYVEIYGEMRRGIAVLKLRGSSHDREIREFTIDGSGMHIGNPFRKVTGILSGNPVHVSNEEIERLGEMFREEP